MQTGRQAFRNQTNLHNIPVLNILRSLVKYKQLAYVLHTIIFKNTQKLNAFKAFTLFTIVS